MLYLSELQKNLLALFDIPDDVKILEVNPMDEAISKFLLSKTNQLYLYKINDSESYDINEKYINLDSLDGEKFDYIIVWDFNRIDNDVKELLEALNQDGILLIMADNRMSFKELSGFKSKNSKTIFDGLYNENKRLYSLKEWKDILSMIVDIEYEMYYPYPDWRFPTYLFSDERLPQPEELNINGLNFYDYRLQLFDDDKLLESINREGMFPQFSNSYLIRIHKVK